MTTRQFNWLLYLDVADHLASRPGEGFHRAATSRAYYGVLCHTRDTLQPFRSTPFSSRGDVHQQVIDALQSDPRPEVINLGKRLNKLRIERNRADYRTNGQFPANRARSAVAEARKIREGIAASFR